MSLTINLLHGGALGDLTLAMRLALHLAGLEKSASILVISRVDPGDLSVVTPAITRVAGDQVGWRWLYAADGPAPESLAGSVCGNAVLNMLGSAADPPHARLQQLQPASLVSIDPRAAATSDQHILSQWAERAGMAEPNAWPSCRLPVDRSGDVLIHPGGGGRAKCWPLADYLEVGRRLRDEECTVRFVLGPVELDWWDAATVAQVRTAFETLVAPSPNGLVTAVASAGLLIGNDSGPGHLAALVGTPTLTLFGPTSATVWQPVGPRATVLTGDPGHEPHGWGITVDQVVRSALDGLTD